MKSLSVALAAVLLVAAAPAEKRLKWKPISSKDGRYKVLMPGTPKPGEIAVDCELGTTVAHTNTVTVGETLYIVNHSDFGAGVKKLSPKEVYDATRDRLVEKVNGKVFGETDVMLGDHPGRETRIELGTDDGYRMFFRYRIFFVGSRLYQFSVSGTKKEADSKNADKFLNSFKLIE